MTESSVLGAARPRFRAQQICDLKGCRHPMSQVGGKGPRRPSACTSAYGETSEMWGPMGRRSWPSER